MLATRRPAPTRLSSPFASWCFRSYEIRSFRAVYPGSVYVKSIRDWGSIPPFSDDVSSSFSSATSTRIMAHLRELAPRKKMLTLLTATTDIDISEAAALAKVVLS
jgi:hypothetical protein